MSDFEFRFGGIERLYSAEALQRLRRARVCVVGIGGVGSWAVEALARSGVGQLALVDMDEVCVSNVNRQLHALDGAVGLAKTEVMARRVQAINPECCVRTIGEFFLPSTAEQILHPGYDYVLDAIDNVPNKCLLIASCVKRGIPIVTVGGAGGRKDPAAIRLADLALSSHDGLLQQVRRKLREEYAFPRDPQLFQVASVFSRERQYIPQVEGAGCAPPEHGLDLRLNCNNGYGTASFVTGTFGFLAASHIVSTLAEGVGRVRGT